MCAADACSLAALQAHGKHLFFFNEKEVQAWNF
jgi:hypothetical protein